MKEKKTLTPKQKKIILIVCIVVLAAAVAGIIGYKVYRANMDNTDELSEFVIEPESVAEPEEEESTIASELPEAPDIPIDFTSLQAQYPDAYAWLRIPDTDIDYPIMQSSQDDTDYYLDHTIDKAEGLPGAIYSQSVYNQKDMTDNVTVVYGHNMRDGSYFGSLKKYSDEEFRNAHSTIYVYTPEHIYTYTLAFAKTYTNDLIPAVYEVSTVEGYQKFLDSLKNTKIMPSWTSDTVQVTTSNKLLILSTCNGNSDQRFLVGAILTNME